MESPSALESEAMAGAEVIGRRVTGAVSQTARAKLAAGWSLLKKWQEIEALKVSPESVDDGLSLCTVVLKCGFG